MEDKQLERLYDYTKFHIGIYLSAAGGLAAFISLAAKGKPETAFLRELVGMPATLALSFALIVLAGIAGAIVATSTIESPSYTSFLTTKQGAYGVKPFAGKTWVTLEHAFFWLALVALAFAIFSAPAVGKLLWSTKGA